MSDDLRDARAAAEPLAYFVRVSANTFRATQHTGGGWSPTEQHISPLMGLVAHAIEDFVAANGPDGGDNKCLSSITYDILGVVAIGEVDVEVSVARPGRTVELFEAVVSSGGRTVLRASAWRLQSGNTQAVGGGQPDRLPPPEDLLLWDMPAVWPGGYVASLDVRRAESQPGRAVVWVSTPMELVAAEQVSVLARYLGLVDTANGIAVRQSPDDWAFPNLTLSVNLYRQPVAGPVGLDVAVTFGPLGQGLTSSVLHDLNGPVGQAAQILTVRPRESGT